MKSAWVSIGILLWAVGCAPASQQGNMQRPSSVNTASCSTGVECQNIGLSYAGRGDQASYTVASEYFQKSCSYGLSEGCNNLAFQYANAEGVDQSYTLAYKYWGMACRMGNGSACSNLQLAKDKVEEMRRNRGR